MYIPISIVTAAYIYVDTYISLYIYINISMYYYTYIYAVVSNGKRKPEAQAISRQLQMILLRILALILTSPPLCYVELGPGSTTMVTAALYWWAPPTCAD
jgi:hypothetical protein